MLRFLGSRGGGVLTKCRTVSSYCFLFPGQGSQRVGMCKELLTAVDGGGLPRVAELFALAETVFGYDLKGLFLDGPQSVLDETVHCQPAVVIASLAALESLKQKIPEVSHEADFKIQHWKVLLTSRYILFPSTIYVISSV